MNGNAHYIQRCFPARVPHRARIRRDAPAVNHRSVARSRRTRKIFIGSTNRGAVQTKFISKLNPRVYLIF